MRDLHSHYLPGVDDGSKSLEETKEMLLNAYKNGVTDIIFTPHYILDSRFTSSKSENEKIIEPIMKFAKEKYNINIFLGNEVYCNMEMLDLYNKGLISTLNGSRYMLIEIPMYSKINNIKSIFFELISNGIIPILAHPERYTAYYNDMDFFMELREMGVLMQMNASSIVGNYGGKAKKMVTKLLKANLISFVGSDIHSSHDDHNNLLPKIEKKLRRIVTDDTFIDITANNFARVIRNDEIV